MPFRDFAGRNPADLAKAYYCIIPDGDCVITRGHVGGAAGGAGAGVPVLPERGNEAGPVDASRVASLFKFHFCQQDGCRGCSVRRHGACRAVTCAGSDYTPV